MALKNTNTLITLVDELKLFCDAHFQIQRFQFENEEQLENISTEGKTFPLCFAQPIDFNKNGNTDIHTIRIYILNRAQRDRSNTLDNYNDTSLILNDLIKYWNSSNKQSDILLDNDPVGTVVNNSQLDNLQGYYADFDFELNTYSRCDIPIPDGVPRVVDGVKILDPILTCSTLNQCSSFIALEDVVDQNVIDITNLQNETDIYTTGSTFDNNTKILTSTRSDGSTYDVDLSPIAGGGSFNCSDLLNCTVFTDLQSDVSTNTSDINTLDGRVTTNESDILTLQNETDIYATNATLDVNNLLTFDRSDSSSFNVDLSSLENQPDVYTDNASLDVNNILTFNRNNATSYQVDLSPIAGGGSFNCSDLLNCTVFTDLQSDVSTNTSDINTLDGRVTTNESDILTLQNETDIYATNATLDVNNLLTFDRSDSSSFNVDLSSLENLPDIYTTSSTLSGNIITFDRTDGNSYSVDLSPIAGGGSFDCSDLLGCTVFTDLQSDVSDNISDISTNTSDINTLDGRVTTNESDILTLQNQTDIYLDGVSLTGNTLIFSLSNLTLYNVDLSTLDLAFECNDLLGCTVFTDLQTDVSDNTSDINTLDGRVTTNESDILTLQNETDVYTDNASLDVNNILTFNRNNSTSYQVDLSPISGGGSFDCSDLLGCAVFTDLQSDVSDNTGDINTLDGRVTDNEGDIIILQDVEYWTFELIQALTYTVYATETMVISQIDDIVGTPTTIIEVNNSIYTLGNGIIPGDKIDVTVDVASVVKLKVEK